MISDPLRFVPETPPRVVMDHMQRPKSPVLLLGWWHDAAGRRVKACILSVPITRWPSEISEPLTPSALGVSLADPAPAHSEVE